ncbi:cysteine desulfurase NifS [Fusibacter ferrireducens]|uniref:Cysteine desulfurase IscS n=1 Tax=Fusibacter ferrireducens TaxID=2785058 RepID=A0ABR9ZUY6_9FIRM|nr:cysteine desulfurase NifS [Fusibacter ferrireducens]MBF4693705.1 cysteine desulfurase NifS [Fusibacter ferrireducens]
MKKIYMDYSATTPVKQEVLDAMMPYFTENFGNASSIHAFGQDAKRALESARSTIAKTMGTTPETVYFTAGGSESDNWALKGVMRANKAKGNHLITTTFEHHGILHTCKALEKEGFEVTYLEVDAQGRISLEALEAAITEKTVMISIMFINNEIGTMQDIKSIGEIARKHKVIFHTDAVQAYGNVHIDVEALKIDLMSISSHKIYGPKGVGALYIRKGIKIQNLIEGGAQERNRRAGTENIAGIMGFAKAAELADANLEEHIERLSALRDRLAKGIIESVDYSRYNGHPTERHPGNVSVCFEFIEGEALLLSLNAKGIAGSSGSACTSGSLDPSHVLLAIGLPHEIAHGSLRLSIGDFTTEEDVDYAIEAIKEVVHKLRMMSPLYDRVLGGK